MEVKIYQVGFLLINVFVFTKNLISLRSKDDEQRALSYIAMVLSCVSTIFFVLALIN